MVQMQMSLMNNGALSILYDKEKKDFFSTNLYDGTNGTD